MLNRGHDRHKDLKCHRGRGTIKGSSSATLSHFLDCFGVFVKIYVNILVKTLLRICSHCNWDTSQSVVVVERAHFILSALCSEESYLRSLQ